MQLNFVHTFTYRIPFRRVRTQTQLVAVVHVQYLQFFETTIRKTLQNGILEGKGKKKIQQAIILNGTLNRYEKIQRVVFSLVFFVVYGISV